MRYPFSFPPQRSENISRRIPQWKWATLCWNSVVIFDIIGARLDKMRKFRLRSQQNDKVSDAIEVHETILAAPKNSIIRKLNSSDRTQKWNSNSNPTSESYTNVEAINQSINAISSVRFFLKRSLFCLSSNESPKRYKTWYNVKWSAASI